MPFKVITRGNRVAIRAKLNPEDYVCVHELTRLRYYDNPGLLRCELQKQELTCEGEGLVLSSAERRGISYPDALGLLRQLRQLWSFTQTNCLSFRKILFHPDYVLFDSGTGAFRFLYYPVSGNRPSYNPGEFLLDRLAHMDVSEGMRRRWENTLMQAVPAGEQADWGSVLGELLGMPTEGKSAPVGGGFAWEQDEPTGVFDDGHPGLGGFDPDATGYFPEGMDGFGEEATGVDSNRILPDGQNALPSVTRISNGEKHVVSKKSYTLGRSRQRADFCVYDNSRISNVHAVIVNENGRYYLMDNGSRNGTFVAGQELRQGQKVELQDGTAFQLYDEGFVFGH